MDRFFWNVFFFNDIFSRGNVTLFLYMTIIYKKNLLTITDSLTKVAFFLLLETLTFHEGKKCN